MNQAGRCAACRYLRRKCPADCIFSPHFPPTDPQKFASVHRIYGASNVAKMLQQLPEHLRAEAAESIYMEAQCRIQDPVYGCVATISSLQHQIQDVESQLARAKAELALLNSNPRHAPSPHLQLQLIDPADSSLVNLLPLQGNSGSSRGFI